MLPYALALGGVLLAVLVVRQLRGKRAPILITILVLLLAAGGWVEYRWDRDEAALTAAVRALIGRHDVEVDCQRLSGTLLDGSINSGWVEYPQHGRATVAQLKYEVCSDLADWRSDGERGTAPLAQVQAVHVLTHEAMHLAGDRDEATAECHAMQHDAEMARLLGASTQAAAQLADRYWRESYPNMPADYRSAECGPGRSLDLHPDTDAWPTG